MGGVNLENDVKFQIHGPFELGSQFFYRIIEENVPLRYMKILQKIHGTFSCHCNHL